MRRSFANLHQEWIDIYHRNNSIIETYLSNSYRSAWLDGNSRDRQAVMHFIYWSRKPSDFYLLIEGLNDSDLDVSTEAAAIIFSLLNQNVKFNQDIRDVLKEFGEKRPDWSVFSQASIDIINAQSDT